VICGDGAEVAAGMGKCCAAREKWVYSQTAPGERKQSRACDEMER